jgi:hypothetical protein
MELSMMFRNVLLAVMMLAALALGACSPEDPFIQTPRKTTVKNPAFLRVIHAAADGPEIEVLVGDSLFFDKPQKFLTFETGVNEARYYPVDTSSKTLTFRGGGTDISSQLSLKNDHYYTAYFYGRADAYHILVTQDTLFPAPSSEQSRIRAVNLSPDSPPISIYIGTDLLKQQPGTQLFSNVASGTASTYTTAQAYHILGPGTELAVKDDKGNLIFWAPKIFLPGTGVLTLLVSGNTYPKGDEPFLFLSPFPDNTRIESNGQVLYGIPPLFQVRIAPVRFLNLVPTAHLEMSKDSSLNVAFYDPADQNYADNEFFRRNFVGQQAAMYDARPLAFVNIDTTKLRPHLLLNADRTLEGKKGYFPYRIEVNHILDGVGGWTGPADHVLVPAGTRTEGIPFTIEAGKRYSIVAFGPFEEGPAKSVVVKDNSPLPSAGMAGIRLFHGAFGEYESRKLKLRVAGRTGEPIGYGELPTPEDAFEVPPGESVSIELLDETGTVIHTETNQKLRPGKAYTVYLSRGAYHETPTLVLTPMAEDIRF